MKAISLFDGISCARVALERAGFEIDKYYSSEIDRYAITIAQKNYPDTIQIGDVTKINGCDYKDIDLLIGGSPCQDLSIAKKGREGLSGSRSGLFWEYVRILKEVKPKYFILENVNSMPKEAKEVITETLGVEPIMINASLVSAQNRKRLFWTNIPNVYLPEDRGILLKDILEDGVVDRDKRYAIDASYFKGANWEQYKTKCRRQLVTTDRVGLYLVKAAAQRGRNIVDGKRKDILGAKTEQRIEIGGDKANTITKVQKDSMVLEDSIVRKLTPIECERLQSLPDNYTEGISNTQRYRALGNAFNVEVVKHILLTMRSV